MKSPGGGVISEEHGAAAMSPAGVSRRRPYTLIGGDADEPSVVICAPGCLPRRSDDLEVEIALADYSKAVTQKMLTGVAAPAKDYCPHASPRGDRTPQRLVPDLAQTTAVVAALAEETCEIQKPFFRGKIHLALICLSPWWIGHLLQPCATWNAVVAALISVVSGCVNFCASMLLHNFSWSPTINGVLQRIDHAGIFMMISGSTSPIPMLLLEKYMSLLLLVVQWGATAYGIVTIVFGNLSTAMARKRRTSVYIVVGLLNALFITEYMRVLTKLELFMVISLAALYILGAVVYAKRWPDPFPGVFGFHEIFHACCLGSAVCTFYLDYSILVRAGGVAAATEASIDLQ